jgi:succinate dehydrogenase / fumarate reductase membrane anchor subunit
MVTQAGGHERPASGFELYAWFFMRISGVLLVFLALGHLVIMHVLNNVDVINYKFVADRWANPIWRVYDWTMLMLALLHGFNGARILVDDYVSSRGWRLVWLTSLAVLMLLTMILGTEVVLTFRPVAM